MRFHSSWHITVSGRGHLLAAAGEPIEESCGPPPRRLLLARPALSSPIRGDDGGSRPELERRAAGDDAPIVALQDADRGTLGDLHV